MIFEGRLVVITGATGNLGRVVARRFAEEGADIVAPWRNEDKWESLRTELDAMEPGRCAGWRTDVTDEDQVKALMENAVGRFGGTYALLNLVGAFAFGENLWETDEATWDKMLDVNLKSAFLCCKHAIPVMLRGGEGRIVNVSSKAAVDVQPGSAAYAVAKGGVVTLTRALREELCDTNVTVNAVMPGIIDTPATRKLMPEADFSKWVQPGEIADVLVGLCAPAARCVSGSVIRIFGEL